MSDLTLDARKIGKGRCPDDDTVLVQRIQDGERVAFATLVTRHHQRFYRLAYRQVFDQAEAEDIVQDCFIKFWQNPNKFDLTKGTAFTSWFSRVVINRSRDSQRRRTHLELDAEMPAESDDDHEDTKAAVRQALRDLPERQRSAVNLCFYEGHTNRDAANILGIKVKALESLLMRAKTKLQQILQVDCDD